MNARGTLYEIRQVASLVRMRLWSKDPRALDTAGYGLVERFARWASPGYQPSKPGKRWFSDTDFLRTYDRLVQPTDHRRSAERKYFLRSLLSLADGLPGDTAECGIFNGASSWFICSHFEESGKVHHGFDSFEGLPEPAPLDGHYWRQGDCRTSEEVTRANLTDFQVELYKGWIPERFEEVADRRFCFVHVDVDLYEPTLESIRFFYPRMVSAGILLFDDYGSAMSPGAAKAVDDFVASCPEPLIESPTQQAFLIKR
jgi:O-methyltransferase